MAMFPLVYLQTKLKRVHQGEGRWHKSSYVGKPRGGNHKYPQENQGSLCFALMNYITQRDNEQQLMQQVRLKLHGFKGMSNIYIYIYVHTHIFNVDPGCSPPK